MFNSEGKSTLQKTSNFIFMDGSVDHIGGLGNSHVFAGWAMVIQSSALGPFEGGIKNVMSFSSDHLE